MPKIDLTFSYDALSADARQVQLPGRLAAPVLRWEKVLPEAARRASAMAGTSRQAIGAIKRGLYADTVTALEGR